MCARLDGQALGGGSQSSLPNAVYLLCCTRCLLDVQPLPFQHSCLLLLQVCPTRYEWVAPLLPKLRDVDVRKLSGAASAAAAAAAGGAADKGKHKLSDGEAAEGAGPSKAAKKADDKSVDAARARYLARKAQQTSSGKARR